MSHLAVFVFLQNPARVAMWLPGRDNSWQELAIHPDKERGLLTSVDELLKSIALPVEKVTHVGVVAGPASYTQLRVSVTTANSLAWSLRLPLFKIPVDTELPNDLPKLITTAKINHPVAPVYPNQL